MYALGLDGSYPLSLADSVTTSDDGLVWTYKIHDGIKFHDGTSLTAEDVVFSYNLYQATVDFPCMDDYTTYFEKVEATASNEVVIFLRGHPEHRFSIGLSSMFFPNMFGKV